MGTGRKDLEGRKDLSAQTAGRVVGEEYVGVERIGGRSDEPASKSDRVGDGHLNLAADVPATRTLADGGKLQIIAVRRIAEVMRSRGAGNYEGRRSGKFTEQPFGNDGRPANVTEAV